MKFLIVTLLSLQLLFSISAEAKMYKVEDENGKVTYSNVVPSHKAEKVEESHEVIEDPAAKSMRLEKERHESELLRIEDKHNAERQRITDNYNKEQQRIKKDLDETLKEINVKENAIEQKYAAKRREVERQTEENIRKIEEDTQRKLRDIKNRH